MHAHNEKAIPPIVPIAGRGGGAGIVAGLVYRTSDGWTCLEIVGGPGGASCGTGEGALLGTSWNSSGGTGDLVTGGTGLDGASGVYVLLDDGRTVSGTVAPVPAPIAPPGVNVFVVALPPGRTRPASTSWMPTGGRSRRPSSRIGP